MHSNRLTVMNCDYVYKHKEKSILSQGTNICQVMSSRSVRTSQDAARTWFWLVIFHTSRFEELLAYKKVPKPSKQPPFSKNSSWFYLCFGAFETQCISLKWKLPFSETNAWKWCWFISGFTLSSTEHYRKGLAKVLKGVALKKCFENIEKEEEEYFTNAFSWK